MLELLYCVTLMAGSVGYSLCIDARTTVLCYPHGWERGILSVCIDARTTVLCYPHGWERGILSVCIDARTTVLCYPHGWERGIISVCIDARTTVLCYPHGWERGILSVSMLELLCCVTLMAGSVGYSLYRCKNYCTVLPSWLGAWDTLCIDARTTVLCYPHGWERGILSVSMLELLCCVTLMAGSVGYSLYRC